MTDRSNRHSPLRRIHLIRHGETNWNRERRAQGQQESVLTERGIAQAHTLARALGSVPVDEVYSSSSVRARQTTEILFGERTVPIEYCDLLREIHMGGWEGRLYADLEAEDPAQFRAFWHEPHRFLLSGAETFETVQQRALSRLDDILSRSTAQQIAIVSHGVWIKTLLCHAEKRPLKKLWQPPAMHNCAHSIIDIHADGSRHISLYANQPYPVDPPATEPAPVPV